jgi:uncharacterized protein (DUF1778 family)
MGVDPGTYRQWTDDMKRAAMADAKKVCDQAARIAELEAALRKINALIDSPARFNSEVQAVLDSVIDTSDVKFNTKQEPPTP